MGLYIDIGIGVRRGSISHLNHLIIMRIGVRRRRRDISSSCLLRMRMRRRMMMRRMRSRSFW